MSESNSVGRSWYTKWRPHTLEEYCGDEIKKTFTGRFSKRENMPHVIMISGPRGCGKTTISRIATKYFLCENPHEDGTPCEECEACRAVNEILIDNPDQNMECPGVTEVDATVMNGKSEIQELLEDAMQVPMYSEFKVLIIDEVHMVTQAAQNSMLKIIEDIPQHLIVIFATTNPEKVLQTIKSRCQLNLQVKKQSVQSMADRLEVIAKAEGLEVSKKALEVIAKKADRVPRESINLLESVAKTYNNKVTLETVEDYIGGISSELYLDYIKAANESLTSILEFVSDLKVKDIKIYDFVTGLMGFILDCLYIEHKIAFEDYPVEYIKSIKEVFDIYTSNEFDMLLQIIEYLSNNVIHEDSPKNEVLLVMTAMRISKLNLLAQGLASEGSQAVIENKISLYEHAKMLKENRDTLAEALDVELTSHEINETFDNVSQVQNSIGLLDSIKIPEVNIQNSIDETDVEDNTSNSNNSTVDDFFNNDM